MKGKIEAELSEFGENRRQFLKLLGVGSAAALAQICGLVFHSNAHIPDLTQPPKISGIIPNSRLLPYDKPEVQEIKIRNAQILGASCVRVFIDDRFESRLGDYQYEPLEQVRNISRRIPVTLDLWDAVQALYFTDSAYLLDKEGRDPFEKQMAILTDTEVSGALINRVRIIVSELKNEPGIWAWGLANELNLKRGQHRKIARLMGVTLRFLHTQLFENMIREILSVDNTRPILLGVEDPNLVDEDKLYRYRDQVYNTIHVYPTPYHDEMIDKYLSDNNHNLRLITQEVGYSKYDIYRNGSDLLDQEYDNTLANFLQDVFTRLYPHSWVFGPWKITAKGDTDNKDGYGIEPDKMPMTLGTLIDIKSAMNSIYWRTGSSGDHDDLLRILNRQNQLLL